MRDSSFILAWSDDGRAVLLEHNSNGPEGGRALSYVLVHGGERESFVVSNTLSRGGPPREYVPVQECLAAVEKLRKRLVGFTGVEARSPRCKSRDNIVLTLKRHAEQAADSLLQATPGGFRGAQATAILKNRTLTISPRVGAPIAIAIQSAANGRLRLGLSPTRALLLVFATTDDDAEVGEFDLLEALPLP